MDQHHQIIEALVRFAQNSQLLVLLDTDGLNRLAGIAQIRRGQPGEVIVRQGESGDAFYLIASGRVRVLVSEVVPPEVAVLEAGSFFGEIAVLTRQLRTATVECMDEVELISFERDVVMSVLDDYPRVKEVLGGVGLMRSEQNLENQGLDDAEGGLADLLESDEDSQD